MFSITCGSCHMFQEPRTGRDGKTRIQLEPFVFRSTIRAPNTTRFSVTQLATALAAELAGGPKGGDSAYLQGLYVLATQAQTDMNGTNCSSRWHCSQTDLQSLANVASPLYLLRRAYVMALSVLSTAANRGAPFDSHLTDALQHLQDSGNLREAVGDPNSVVLLGQFQEPLLRQLKPNGSVREDVFRGQLARGRLLLPFGEGQCTGWRYGSGAPTAGSKSQRAKGDSTAAASKWVVADDLERARKLLDHVSHEGIASA